MAIPKHWASSKLGELIIIRKGKKPEKLSFKKFNDSVPYLDILAIEKGTVIQYADSHSSLLSKSDDLFIVADGSRSGLVGKDAVGAVGSTILCITPIGVNYLYLYYFLKLKYEDLNGNTTGVSIPHLNLDFFLNLELPLPPIEEQKRIVTELQNRLMAFESEFSNAEDELGKLADYKKSLLNEAVTGKLTLKIIKSDNSEEHSTWADVAIQEIADFIGSGVTPSGGASNYKKKGVPFLRSQNIYPNELRLNDVVYISEDLHAQMKRTHVKANDVLLNITGASIGRSACIPEGFGEANVNQHVCIIRVNEIILPAYLSLFLNSPIGQDSINSLQKGVTRQGLNYHQIKSINIHLPPKKIQIDIINEVNNQLQKIQMLEKEYTDKINNSIHLENALINMAFDGNLTSRREEDGDASELLLDIENKKKKISHEMAKIRAEQAEKSKSKKIKLDKNMLISVIKENFSNSSFTSSELYNALKIENKYDTFSTLLFELLQENLEDKSLKPFLEAKYDKVLKTQTLTIRNYETSTT